MEFETGTRRTASARQTSSLYLMSWVAVAAFGLGYIGVAATRPDLLGTILPLAEPVHDQMAGRQANDLAEEMAAMRKWIHELQHDLASTKSALQEQAAVSSSIALRLTATEDRLSTLREVKEPAGKQAPSRVQTRAQAAPAQPATGTTVAAAAQPTSPAQSEPAQSSTGSGFRVINTAVAPIATGSVPEAATVPGTPATKAPQPPVAPRAIEIGSADSIDGLRSQWGEIAGRNADVLGGATARYRLSSDGRPQPFTLLAGPFDTPADATRACNALKAKGLACRVSGAFGGNTF